MGVVLMGRRRVGCRMGARRREVVARIVDVDSVVGVEKGGMAELLLIDRLRDLMLLVGE